MIKRKLTKNVYIILLVLEFLIVVFTPALIKDGLSFIKEEYIEGIIIFFVFIIWYFTYKWYENQIIKKELLLEENFKYIWSINVQVDESARILAEIEQYPENRKDLVKITHTIGQKTLKIFKLDRLLIKIIDTSNWKNIEQIFSSKDENTTALKIDNTTLLEWGKIENCKTICSEAENINSKVFFIVPRESKIDSSNMNLIKAILIKIEMLFIIHLKK